MRVDSAKTQHFLTNLRKKNLEQDSQKSETQTADIKVELNSKPTEHFKISENSPNDPTVSTKVLDSLNMGMINFSQKERDVLATIMSEKANSVKQKME